MSEEEIDLKELFNLVWKKKIFVTLITILFLIIGGVFSFSIKTQTYTAYSYITFGRIEGYIPQEGESQLLSEIQFNNSILGNYKSFMLSNDVLNTVIENLHLNGMKLGDLKEKIEITTANATINIEVTNSDEKTAENIANELIKVFTEKSKDFYQINHTYTISDADESTTETSTNHIIDLVVFSLVGMIIAIAIIVVKFIFNPSIISEKNIEDKLNASYIATINTKMNGKRNFVEALEQTEQIDVLRANIEFSTQNDKTKKTMYITSINKKDGKTYVSANLAQSFAKTGKRVLVIDADKKDGIIDRVFEVENSYGLSNYLIDSNKISEKDNKTENNLIQSTKIENLDVVTIGTIKGKRFNIIQNQKFIKFLEEMKEVYDVVILDGTEMLQYADSRFLSNICDGTLLLVKKDVTRENDVIKATKEIKKVNGNLLGIVLNEMEK